MIKKRKSVKFQRNQNYVISGKNTLRKFSGAMIGFFKTIVSFEKVENKGSNFDHLVKNYQTPCKYINFRNQINPNKIKYRKFTW